MCIRDSFEGWFHGYIMWVAEIWFDALGVDCLWFCHSKKMIIPGTEDLVDAYHDYWHHIKYCLLYTSVSLLFWDSIIISLVYTIFHYLLISYTNGIFIAYKQIL